MKHQLLRNRLTLLLLLSFFLGCKTDEKIGDQKLQQTNANITVSSSLGTVSIDIPMIAYCSNIAYHSEDSEKLKVQRNVYYFKSGDDTCSLLIDYNFDDLILNDSLQMHDKIIEFGNSLSHVLQCKAGIKQEKVEISNRMVYRFNCNDAVTIKYYMDDGSLELTLVNVKDQKLREAILKSIRIE